MSEIKVGSVAYLRTTEEPVFILKIGKVEQEIPGLSGMLVDIRRPVAGRNGIQHLNENCWLEELQTEEEFQASKLKQKKQNLNDMLGIKMFPAEGEDGPDAKKYN